MAESIDQWLALLTKHKVILGVLLVVFFAGSYQITRWRTSGARRMINDHNDLLDEMSTRLNGVRLELDNTREELSTERNKRFRSEERAATLEARVVVLEAIEKELQAKINEQ